MKKISLILVTVLLVFTSSLFAQEKDHPLIGHLDGADLWVQNVNNIHEYTIITGAIKNDSLASSIKVVGKTTMTAYDYKGDNSAFGIIHNYTQFLEAKGFEILFSCKSGECGGNLSKHYVSLNKLETGDNSVAPAFSDASYFRNYLSAKKQEDGKTVYVCIFIAQGYWGHPVYRIDVVEEEEATSMIKNDNDTDIQDKDNSEIDNSKANTGNKSDTGNASNTTGNSSNKNTNSFTFQVGIGQHNFYDTQLYGDHVIMENNGFYSGVLTGFKDLSGPYAKTAYYFNKNIGVTADVAFQHGENGVFYENPGSVVTYETSADLNFQRVGLIGRFVGEEYPIKLAFGTGFGRGSFEAYYQIKTLTTQIDYEGKVSFPMVYFQTEIVIPIIKGLFIFTEYEYSVAWLDEFNLIHDNGSEYNEIKYKWPSLGGNNFRFGLGYEFGGQ
ncbi:MAG: hypothetical protein GQ574_20805 [Crocinitomix sp.]|nr:hypothetical protein [Crocinitomix sp.]